MPSQIVEQQMDSSHPLKPKLPRERAPIEKLPTELLRLGTEALAQQPHPYDDIQHDLLSCLLTSHKLNETAIPLVYRNVKFSKGSTFRKFLDQLTRYPSLGKNVQSLDLSELSGDHVPTAEALDRCLNLTPLLRGFLAPPEIDINERSLQRLLCELPQLQLLSLQECNSTSFANAFISLSTHTNLKVSSSITQLNLQGCNSLPCSIFEELLPQLPHLEMLDAANTNLTDSALSSIVPKAKLTHLNISNCAFLSGRSVSHILSTHPSFRTSLVSLSAETKPIHEDATLSEEDLSRLLPNLPSTLRSLNLKRSAMTPEHLPYLQKLCTHLEELRVGTDLRLQDLESLFTPAVEAETQASRPCQNTSDFAVQPPSTSCETNKTDPVLTPMEQAVAVCKLRQRLNTTPLPQLSSSSSPGSRLRFLDISSMSIFQQRKITGSILLGDHSLPLEKIVVGEEVYLMGRVLFDRVTAAVGWVVGWDERGVVLIRNGCGGK